MESRQEIAKQLFTLRDYVRWAVSRFHQAGLCYGHGTDNPWDEALRLALHSLHVPHEFAEQVLDARLTVEERRLLMVVFDTRVIERIPVPYLTGEAWFAGFRFKVDERVLIPRSPMAELIESDFQPWLADRQVHRVLDLCTGSGCIGIACALYNPQLEVDLVDLSEAAIEVARINIEKYDLQGRVRVIRSDLFAGLTGSRYDLILTNPPYVDAADLAAMPAEFHHEPVMALAAGDDGLSLARRILRQAVDYLTDEGLLFMEVGNSGMTLEELYPQVPFTWIDFERGGHGVMVFSRDELLPYRELFV